MLIILSYGARETTAYVAAQSNSVYAATYRALSEVNAINSFLNFEFLLSIIK